jgi:hypothetical protein
MLFSSLWRKLTQRTTKRNRSGAPRRLGGRWRRRLLPRLEWLEDRTAPATFTVNSTADGVLPAPFMSLRSAITAANANGAGLDTIVFAIPGAGPHTFVLGSALPNITSSLIIDGTTQAGYTFGVPSLILDGTGLVAANGLSFTPAGTEDLTVFGLRIQDFDTNGLRAVGNGAGTDITLQDVILVNNASDGISLVNVGAVNFTSAPGGLGGVTALVNGGAGMTALGATSLNIIDGNFSTNNDGGIRVSDISGSVTLTRVQTIDNDFDGDTIGNGFEATDGVDFPDTNAIGGALTVNGGSFSSTNVADSNIVGFFVQSIAGAVVFQDSSGPADSVDITGNYGHGLFINDGGTTMTISNADFSGNGVGGVPAFGGDGIRAFSFSGVVTLTNLLSNTNFGAGADLDGIATLTVNGGSYSGNGLNGLDIDTTTTVNLTLVAAGGNGGDGANIEDCTTVNVTNGFYSGNTDDGIDLDDIAGVTTLNGVAAAGNSSDGLQASDLLGTLNVISSSFTGNTSDGLDIFRAAAVVCTNVTATDNDPGILLDTVASFTDTDGNYSENENSGIYIIDVSGSVTLTRTTANDNDQSAGGFGDGLSAFDGGDTGTVAIGGNLTVNGGSFSQVNFTQQFGFFVEAVGGNVTFQNSGIQQVSVRDNQQDGVFIGGGVNGTFDNGFYVDNGTGTGEDNIDLENFTGTVSLTNVTSTGAGSDGLEADNIANLVINGGTYSTNLDQGVDAHDLGTVSVTGGLFNGNTDDGIHLGGVTVSATMTDVTAEGNGGDGFEGHDSAGDFNFNGGSYSSNDTGVRLESITGDVDATDVTASDNTFDGFFAFNVTGTCTATGGFYDDNGIVGIEFEACADVNLNGVTATGNDESGALVEECVGTFTATGGVFSSNVLHGIQVQDHVGDVDLDGITAQDNDSDDDGDGDGVNVDADVNLVALDGNLTVDNATIGNTNPLNLIQEHGVFVESITGAISATGSSITFNAEDGFEVDDGGTTAFFSGGTYSNNGQDGIDLFGFAETISLLNVTAQLNDDDGLEVTTSADVDVTGGSFSDNDEDGIDLFDVADVFLTDVTANDNGSDGLDAFNVGDIFIDPSFFNGNTEDGMEINDAGDVTIDDTQANNNGDDGIDVDIVTGLFLTNVTASDNLHQGLEANDVGGAVDIASSFFDNNASDGVDINTAGDVSISGTRANSNGDEGIDINDVTSLTISANSIVNFNDNTGLEGSDIGDVNISDSQFNDNGQVNATGDGIELTTVADVTFTNVTARGNDPGVNIIGAASFSDTSGNFSNNDDHGVLLTDIAGNVTLVRTIADNNDVDNDGLGDGVRLADGLDGNNFAVGGNVVVQGARFRDLGGVNDHQEFGFFADVAIGPAIAGNVTFEDSAGPVQTMSVTGNENDGVFIDGATNGTFTNGSYSSNGNHGIELINFTGTITLTDVTANTNVFNGFEVRTSAIVNLVRGTFSSNLVGGIHAQNLTTSLTLTEVTANLNGEDGLDADPIPTVTVNRGTYNNNTQQGIDLDDITTVVLNQVTASNNGQHGFTVDNSTTLTVNDHVGLGNVSGFGGQVQNVTTFNFDTTTLPAGNTVADIVEFFPTSAGFNRFQHTRAASVQQAIRYCAVTTLDVDFFGGDDEARINPGSYVACVTNLSLDGGAHINGDTITYLGTTGNDDIDVTGLVVTVNGVVQPGGLGAGFTVTNFELLGVDALAGNDTIDFLGSDPTVGYILFGNTGDDIIRGTGATHTTSMLMRGGDNNDTIQGTLSADVIEGGNGNDTLFGDNGNDTIRGEAGNDSLEGETGDDSLDGGSGNDTFFFNGTALGTDLVHDLPGNVDIDTLDFSGFTAAGGITLNLATVGVQTVNAGDLDLNLTNNTSIENVIGTTNSDSITGNACNNNLVGGNGDDTLIGAVGNDTLNGGAGSDFYPYTGTLLGTDNIVEPGGCVDFDKLDFSAFPTAVNINLSLTGTQVVSAGNLSIILSTADGIENLDGSAFNDTLTGNACPNVIQGLNGNDSIQGLAEADNLSGNDGNDTLVGGTNPAATRDTHTGGNGNDLMIWNPGDGDDIMDGNADTDTVQVNGAAAAETFRLQADPVNVGPRLDFDRLAPTPFNLDVGTTEIFDINMNAGNDVLTVNTALPGVTTLDVDGGPDDDALILDLTLSNTLPTTVTYAGGTNTAAGEDIFRVQGAGAALATAAYTATSSNSGSANLGGQIANFSTTERIDHVKLAAAVTYDLTFADDSAQIVDGPVVNGVDTTQINSLSDTFPTMNVGNLTGLGLLQVSGQGGSDRFRLDNPDAGDGILGISLFGHNPGGVGDDGQVDRFIVTPSLLVPYFVDGNEPEPGVCPGDSLDIVTAGLVPSTTPTLNPGVPGAGFYSFTNGYENVTFVSIEDLSGLQIVVTGTDYGTTQRVRAFQGTVADGANHLLPLGGAGSVWDVGFNPFGPGFKSGIRVAAGDVNGDCFPDIVVAAGPQSKSFIKVYDGFDARTAGVATLIGSFQAFENSFLGGTYVAVADMDGDFIGDIIVGAGKPKTAQIRIFSGPDVTSFNPAPVPIVPDIVAFPATFKGGARVAAGDYNGDTINDLAVTIGSGQTTRVRVIDGSQLFDGFDPETDLLDDFQPFGSRFKRGAFISMVDLDGDGDQEIQVGISNESNLQNVDFSTGPGVKIPPQVRVFDYLGFDHGGAERSPLYTVVPYAASVNGGVRLGSLFDNFLDTVAPNSFFLTAPGKTNPLANTIFTSPAAKTIKRFNFNGATVVEDALFAHEFSQQGYFVAGSKRNDGRVF